MDIILAALILLAQATTAPVELAAILEGEAGICGVEAMITVPGVYQNNPNMNGRKVPRQWSLWAAVHWPEMQTTAGLNGRYMFSHRDLAKPAVIALKRGLKILDVFKCSNGGWLFVYGGHYG